MYHTIPYAYHDTPFYHTIMYYILKTAIKQSVNKSPTFSVDDFWIISKDVGAVTGLEVKINNTENRPSWAFDYVSEQKSF